MKFSNFLDIISEYVTGGSRAARKYDKSQEAENAVKSSLQSTYSSGMRVVVSVHAGSQALVRRPDMEPKDWRVYLKRATKALKSLDMGDYIIHSKEFDQAVVMGYYPKKKLVRLITTLPKGRSNPKPGTEKVMVEELNQELEVINVD